MSDSPTRRRFRIPGGASGRGVLAISAGTGVAQLVTIAAGPVIARLYSPDELGIYTIIASSSTILAMVAALRWDFAIPLPDNETDAHSLVMLGLYSVAGTTIVSTLVLLLWGTGLADLLGNDRLLPWLLLVPVVAAGQAVMRVLNQLAVRHRRYAAIGRRNTFRSVFVVGIQVVLGLFGARDGGLAIGLGVGNAAGAISLVSGTGFRTPEARAGRRLSTVRANALRYRRFPLLLTPSGLLNVLGVQLPVLLIAALYGSEVAGWLGLTQTVLALPVALLGQAVAQVYLGELSRARRESPERYRRLFRTASRHLFVVASAITLALLALAPLLFPIVFGEQWATSGRYAQALAPSLGLQMLAVPLSNTLVVMSRQGTQLFWDASRLVLAAGGVAVCWMLGGSAYAAVWVYSIGSSLAYLLLWDLSRRAVLSSDGSGATAS